MATQHGSERNYYNPYSTIGWGVAAGVVAGTVFGLMIQLVMGRMVAIGALYTLGEPSLTVGWIAHLVHSALFGLVFAGLSLSQRLERHFRAAGTAVVLGAVYGLTLWFVNIGFLWPAWLNYVSFGPEFPIPFFTVQPLVGHLVYGAATGGLFALLSK